MAEYRCISEALDKARAYYKRLFWDLGSGKGIMKEGPGCPLALRNTTLGLWRYPGRRRANIIKAITLGEPEEYDYYWEDDDTLLEWDWPFHNDVVINVKRRFMDANTVRWELDCTEKNRADSLDVYLADVRIGQNISDTWNYCADFDLGKMSSGLKYPPRYQRSMGLIMRELGLVSEGDKCIAQFDYSAPDKYDLYEVLWGYGAGRDDNWLCTRTTFHENETADNWPEGTALFPYKTRLRAPWPYITYDTDRSRRIANLRDLYIADNVTGVLPAGWSAGPNPGSFKTGPLYDALQAIHLMNKYGASYPTDVEYRLNRCDFDGHGSRRYYYWPNSSSSKLPFAGTRPQYASYCLGAFAVAALKWWRLTGIGGWKTKAEEAIDVILKIMVWNDYITTDGGTFFRPCDTGGCYIGYMPVNGYISYSWDSYLFQLADTIANKFPLIIGETYRDSSDFVGVGTTSYEGTMMCVKALLDYRSSMLGLMHPCFPTEIGERSATTTPEWQVDSYPAEGAEHEVEAIKTGELYVRLTNTSWDAATLIISQKKQISASNLVNPKFALSFNACVRTETTGNGSGYTATGLHARGMIMDMGDDIVFDSGFETIFEDWDGEGELRKLYEEKEWQTSETFNGNYWMITQFRIFARGQPARAASKFLACGHETVSGEQWNRGILAVMMDLQPS